MPDIHIGKHPMENGFAPDRIVNPGLKRSDLVLVLPFKRLLYRCHGEGLMARHRQASLGEHSSSGRSPEEHSRHVSLRRMQFLPRTSMMSGITGEITEGNMMKNDLGRRVNPRNGVTEGAVS